MSNSKKIRNRLDKLFTGIEEPETEEVAPATKKAKRASTPMPTTPLPTLKKTQYTGPLSPSTLEEMERNVTMTQVDTGSSSTVMAIPFQTGDEWSLIQLEQEEQARPWKDEQKSLVRQVADQLGLALQNARLFEETQKSAQQMTAVAEIATSITSILDLQHLLETAVHLTQRRFGLYHAHIFLPEKDNQLLVVKACGWIEGDPHEGTHGTREIGIDSSISIVAQAAREKRAILDNDVHADPNWLPNPLLPDVQAEMAIPALLGDRVLGVLNIHSDKLNFFTDADQSIMATLATQIASAIENARLFEETQKRTSELSTLNEIIRTVSQQIDLKQLLDAAFQQIKKLVPVDAFTVSLYDEATNMVSYPLVVDEGKYYDEIPTPFNLDNYTGQTIASGKILRIDLTPEEAAAAAAKVDGAIGNTTKISGSLIFLPLKVGQKTIGCISVQSYSFFAYGPSEAGLLESVANQISVAIQNAQLYSDAQRRSLELGVINELARETAQLLQVDEICKVVYKYISQLIDSHNFFIALYEEKENILRFPVSYIGGEPFNNRSRGLGNGLSDYIIRHNEPLLLAANASDHLKDYGIDFIPIADDRPAQSWLGVPLSIGSRVLGVIVVQSVTTNNLYTEHHRDLLVSIAGQVSILLENTRLYTQEQYRRSVADALSEMARIAASSLDQKEVARRLLQQMPRLLQFNTATIQLVDEDGRREQIGGISINKDRQQDVEMPKGQFLRPVQDDLLINEVYKTRQTVFIPDTHNDPRWEVLSETKHIRSWMCSPLVTGDQVLGFLILDHDKPNIYNAEAAELADSISAQVSGAIQNASLFAETQQRTSELAGLNEIMRAVSSEIDLGNVLEAAYEKIRNLVKADVFILGLYDETTKRISYPINIDEEVHYKQVEEDLTPTHSIGKVILSGKPIIILRTPEEYKKITPKKSAMGNVNKSSASLLFIPIVQGAKTIGVFSIQSYEFNAYTENDLHLMENVSNQLSVAIQNARLYETMQVSETRFRDVALASADWVWEIDLNGRYTYCSDKVYDVLGYKPEELLGRTPTDFMSELEAGRVGPILDKTLAEKERLVDFENRNLTKAGQEVILLLNGLPILDDAGNLLGYRGVNKDVTTQRIDQAVDDVIAEIIEASITNNTLEKAFPAIHASILKLIPTKNIYFALYDKEQDLVFYPYSVDEHDAPNSGFRVPHKPSKSLTSYVLHTGKPFLATPETKRPLLESGELVQSGTPSTSWIGIPLRTKEIIGVVSVQSYDEERIFTASHLDILSRLAPQIATVIDKVRAEEALITNEAQLSEALELARMGYWELDPASRNYTLSDEVFTMLNTTAEEMGGHIMAVDRFTQEVVHPDYFAPVYALIQEAYQTEDPTFNAQTETCFYTRDKKIIWVFIRFKVVKDQDGKTIKLVGSVQDISARKEIEDALRRQNEYLATATEVGRLITSTLDLDILFNRTVDLIKTRFNYYSVSIFTVDATGYNAVLREGTGAVGEEMKARKHTLAVGSKSIIGTVTAEGSTMVVNNTATDPIHRPNPLLPETRAETGIPLKIGSRILGALDIQAKEVNAFHPEDIAILETLSDQIAVALDNANSYDLAQKAVAEMRELDRIKSQFLANMSHELRTPLNSIIGFSRVILKGIDGPVSEQQHQDLSAIYNSGQHLLGLINDILDHAKIDAGKLELALEELNIADTVNSVMSTALGLIKDKPIKLKSEIEPSIATVRADPMRIRQVLLNLISNAAKFTDEGSITVTAHTQSGPKGVQEIWVGITDTGPGISPEDQLKLFQAFSQVDSSPTRKTGGSGLGLSICQRMIELHGGKIGVNSAVGKGSTFYFTLPLFHQPKVEQSSGEGRIILCIDDDPQVIGLYERYLQPQGYKVISVVNAANARDTAKRIKPYAITLDIMMPDIDGWTVLEQLKNDPETRNIPVIICSIVEEDEKGFSLGAADYLVKPILEEDLVIALNRLNSDGAIKEVLIIDDSLDDLRLMEKMLTDHSNFHPILAEGGAPGWEIISNQTPDAVILDLFMPDVDGFMILERLRTTPELRDLPVIVVSGMDLTVEQKQQLENLGKHMLQKGLLDEKELFSTLEKALKRLESKH